MGGISLPYLTVAYYFICLNLATPALAMAIPFGLAVVVLRRRWSGLDRRAAQPDGFADPFADPS